MGRTIAKIALTDDQLEALKPVFKDMKDGGAVIAQVYPDGMALAICGPEEAIGIKEILSPGSPAVASSSLKHR